MLITKDGWPTHVGEVILALSGRLAGGDIGGYAEVRAKVDEAYRYSCPHSGKKESRIEPPAGLRYGSEAIGSKNKSNTWLHYLKKRNDISLLCKCLGLKVGREPRVV